MQFVMEENKEKKLEVAARLLEVMTTLRRECPWDREQTFDSLRSNTIEETYELADAITAHDMEAIKEELGDLLLHVVFYSKLGEEAGAFDFGDVANALCDKLIYRHPHVYGEIHANTPEEVLSNWEALKLRKKNRKSGTLGGVPRSLPALVKAGLDAVNISLDSLDEEDYARISRRRTLSGALEGLDAACAYPDLLVKVNCVPIRGMNDEQLGAIAGLARDRNVHVRFIEMMPIGQGCRFHALDNEALLDILKSRYPDLKESKRIWGHGPARYYEFGNHGCAGFISAVHHKFCDRCNRVRLTSDGFLKLCLASEDGVNLRDRIRAGMDDRELTELMKQTIAQKPVSHHFEKAGFGALNMNQIGG